MSEYKIKKGDVELTYARCENCFNTVGDHWREKNR